MTAGILTNAGLYNVIWSWADAAAFVYDRTIQFGTGSGQGATDTALAAPVQDAVAATHTQETTTVDGDTARYTATITADQECTITEVGVFDDFPQMEIYGEFDAITLANGDAISFTINVTASS